MSGVHFFNTLTGIIKINSRCMCLIGEMLRLYLDVETYRPRKGEAFVNEVVIAIGVIEDSTPYSPEYAKVWSEPDVVFKFFTLWDVNGESIDEKVLW